jgi:hypothetical protein
MTSCSEEHLLGKLRVKTKIIVFTEHKSENQNKIEEKLSIFITIKTK